MTCKVSFQLDHLEKVWNTIYPIKKSDIQSRKSHPGQIDPYMFNFRLGFDNKFSFLMFSVNCNTNPHYDETFIDRSP